MSDPSSKTTRIDLLASLRPWSDAAARQLGHDPSKWEGFDFAAVPGVGISVTGRIGKYGQATKVFVTLAEVQNVKA